MGLATIKLKKELVRREDKIRIVGRGVSLFESVPEDLHGNRVLVRLRELLEGL
ncbi:MAG TPA: hypothetical protein VLV54_03805 [Thermoanaerobaculia bacterium]|nr:hypothetical protein [Thermoanaerobaculia bacterium]